MTAPPELDSTRDRAIRAALPQVPFEGWTARALRRGLADIGLDPEIARGLFPNGAVGMIAAWRDLVDREMEAGMGEVPSEGLTKRVRALIVLRFQLLRPHREAARRALATLTRLGTERDAARMAARTADAIWHAAGDKSADFSWYTKRASLAAIYGATLLYWLRHEGEDDGATLAFLDRRLAAVAMIGRIRRRFTCGANTRTRPRVP